MFGLYSLSLMCRANVVVDTSRLAVKYMCLARQKHSRWVESLPDSGSAFGFCWKDWAGARSLEIHKIFIADSKFPRWRLKLDV